MALSGIGLVRPSKAQSGKTIGRTRHPRHGSIGVGQAVSGQAPLAIGAETATDIEGEDDLTALLQRVYSVTRLDNLAEVFVAKDLTLLDFSPAFVDMEIGTAYSR